jgi:two-component system chemotaxis response regulator CheB
MKKNIVVIDDSALTRRLMSDIINKTEQYQMLSTASNGEEGLKLIRQLENVHMIFLDMNMPKLGGLDVLKQMKREGITIPVVVFSAVVEHSSADTIEALSLGAIDFLKKPENILVNMESFRKKVLNILQCIDDGAEDTSVVVKEKPHHKMSGSSLGRGRLVAIACSTGGPRALHEVIPYLPKELNAPVIIVQHMPEGFTESLANRLNDISKIPVREAADGDVLENGKVYVARGGSHLRVVYSGGKHILRLGNDAPVNGLRPYANYMYESLIQSNYYEIICVVMTGMGADGTKGISMLSQEKNVYVVSQDRDSSVVYGMPRMVAQSGLSDEIVPLNKIAQVIERKTGVC